MGGGVGKSHMIGAPPSPCERLMLTYCVDLVTYSVFLQVPRAFVNMVKVLEIIGLRDLYKETKVSCPRIILRSAGCFSPVPKGLWG